MKKRGRRILAALTAVLLLAESVSGTGIIADYPGTDIRRDTEIGHSKCNHTECKKRPGHRKFRCKEAVLRSPCDCGGTRDSF